MQLTSRRYIGSKTKLLDWIFSLIKENTEGESFFDVFAGTGSVAERALETYNKVIVNDILLSNKIIYEAVWGKQEIRLDYLQAQKDLFNNLDPELPDNYFSVNFGDKYFGINDAKKIGYIREYIESEFAKQKLKQREYYVLIASLIYSLDRIANTVGHYETYRKGKIIDDRFVFELVDLKDYADKSIEIYQEDANKLAPQVYSDVVFLDPPYNSRQYSRF